jgi:hypothetical protein
MDGWMNVPRNEIRLKDDIQTIDFSVKTTLKTVTLEECILLLYLISWDIHPSIYLSIHLVTHPLFNMSMAPFNNPPDQSVS